MDMSSSTSNSTMGTTLFVSTNTPLFSAQWTPSTRGQYAGTCISLITLAAVFRGLFSYRTVQEYKWRQIDLRRRQVIVSGKAQDNGDGLDEKDAGAGNGNRKGRSRPWRISTDVPRALLDTVVSGIGYLLSVVPHLIWLDIYC